MPMKSATAESLLELRQSTAQKISTQIWNNDK